MKNVIIYLVILITGELLFSQDGNTPTNLQVDAASVGGEHYPGILRKTSGESG